MHTTPGFEERILGGIGTAFGTEVPVYGGSAADDSLTGNSFVMHAGQLCREGFLLVGISSIRSPLGSFFSGFLPTEHNGIVTQVEGRAGADINHCPAASTYNNWTGGAISKELFGGGNLLLKTNLLPLARSLGEAHGIPRHLLSHPHEVLDDGQTLTIFTDFAVGDAVTLMIGTPEPLVTRVRRAVQRARGTSSMRPRGAILVYCGGSLGGLLDQADKIASEVSAELDGAPFVGIATFGEQGAFFTKGESWHDNLMCSAMIF